MKYALECAVESKIRIGREIEIKHNERTFVFRADNAGVLESLRIVADVKHPERFHSSINPSSKKNVNFDLNIQTDMELHNSIILEFQELESLLAFDGSLRKISWETPRTEILCETDEEKRVVQVGGTDFRREYPDPVKWIDEDRLRELVTTKDRFSSLSIPLAFWREGNIEFKSFRYINAFFNFYFILEGLFGNGKTRNVAVEKEFKKSGDLTEYLGLFVEQLRTAQRHRENLHKMAACRNKKLDVDGLIHLIVATRGNLHHYVDNPNKTQGTPFNHAEFESIAWMALGLAAYAIAHKFAEINKAHEQSSGERAEP